MPLSVGYAQSVITPSLERPVYLAGFGRNRRAASVHDDLYARALALRAHDTAVIVVAADLIGLARHEIQAIECAVQEQAPAVQLVVAATHTHHGPDTLGLWGPDEMTRGVDAGYFAHLKQTLATTALAAYQRLQPAALRAAATLVTDVARNAHWRPGLSTPVTPKSCGMTTRTSRRIICTVCVARSSRRQARRASAWSARWAG